MMTATMACTLLRSIAPETPHMIDGWASSFIIRDLIYSVRIERGLRTDFGIYGSALPSCNNLENYDDVYFVKFDNSLNDLDPTRSFARLPKNKRLSVTDAEKGISDFMTNL